ncbi:MAG: response regulator transcription factor [Burkholderiaceae bacterium]|jgi:DNA-binding NarL/FixJ family response regulator|nr:response regulator transcription factor [Burkholderiales bacterium]MCZ8100038.1 response regulator transcription factor [Burkholderiales bacterium]MCZ8337501.1 response regulator transcription factor [Burkholderiaceae bacterium]
MSVDPTDLRRGVLIADDHVLVRAGVRSLLEGSRRYLLLGEASDVADCLAKVAALRPEVLLLDIMLPDMSGIDAVARIRTAAPAVRIVFLSSQDSREFVMSALQTGADGFLSKDFVLSEMELALDAVIAGNRYLSPRISHVLVEAMNAPPAGEAAQTGLTGRQLEVLRAIARGLSNKEIARELAISPKTVEFHRGALMQRLDLHDVASLTRYAVQAGLV